MPPRRRGRGRGRGLGAAFKPVSRAAYLPPFNSPNLQKFAFHKFVMHLISRPNMASCLSFTPDYFTCKTEFEKFLDFIEDTEEPEKSQLAAAIFPLFVHFYFNMIVESKIVNAKAFGAEFGYIFDRLGYEDILKELLTIQDKKKIEEHPYFNNFRTRKYILKISAAVLKKLTSFFEENEIKALWQTFFLYFYYEDPNVESLSANKKKSKKRQRKSNTTKSNLEKYYSFGSKKPSIPNTEPEFVENENSIDEDESSTVVDSISIPTILETVIRWFKSEVHTVDFNDDETELCMSFGEPCIFTTQVEKHFPVSSDDSEEEDDDEEEEDLTANIPIKISFSDPVRAVKYFPHEPHLLLAASGTTVAKVDTKTQTMESFGDIHNSDIWDIDINSTSSFFCTASRDMSCRLWSFKKSCVLRVYTGHENCVTTVRFHPNGMYLVSGSADYCVRLWSIENSVCLRCLVDHKSAVTTLACCPDKKILASADVNGIVKLWNIEENLRICDIQCYEEDVPDNSKIISLCFADENYLGMCNNKGVMRIWDIRQPKSVFTKVYQETIPILLKLGSLGVWNMVFRDKSEL